MHIISTVVIFSTIILLACSETKNPTMAIYHPDSLNETETKIKQEHNCSYVTYHNKRNEPKTHLRHDLHLSTFNNTYSLISLGYFFALPILIGGYQYRLNVDTGSSDIFIKGQGTKGGPTFKYSCPICLQNAQSTSQLFLLTYLDGEVYTCLLYTSPSPRDQRGSRMPSSA